jgi:hypothetical protein
MTNCFKETESLFYELYFLSKYIGMEGNRKNNNHLLREVKDDLVKLKNDVALVKIDLKVILAKIEERNRRDGKKSPEPISKGWFG